MQSKFSVLRMLAGLLTFGLVLFGCGMTDKDTEKEVTGGKAATEITANTWWSSDLSTSGEIWVKFTATEDTKYIHFSPGLLTGISIQLLDSKGNEQGNSVSLGYYSPNNTAISITSGNMYYMDIPAD